LCSFGWIARHFLWLSNNDTTHEKSGIDTLMCFPARGSFFDLHLNQEQDSPRVPRPISGAVSTKKRRRHAVRRRYCGRVVVPDSKFSIESAPHRHSRESGNPGPQAHHRLPPVQARRRLWTPASEHVKKSKSGGTSVVRACRGRDAHYCTPPGQNRTCPIRASGSHLGWVTAKRCSGQG